MRSLSPATQAHIASGVTTLATCWRVTRPGGVLILGTEHDQDLTISSGNYAGTYSALAGITGSNVRSTADMAVDNLEVSGAVNQGDLQILDLSAADIEAGLFDDASVVLFMVNWQAPDDGQIVLRTGNIGAIGRTAEGQYTAELRGLTQKLTQGFIRTYGVSCDAELGDVRCGLDLAAMTFPGEVTAVTSNRAFTALVSSESPGIVVAIDLFLPMPYEIQVGDTFTIRPGCDKSAPTCQQRFNNLVNFRGHGFWVPGIGELQIFGGQTATRGAVVGGVMASVIEQWFANNPWPAATLGSPGAPFYNGGVVEWTSGENESFSMEVRQGIEP